MSAPVNSHDLARSGTASPTMSVVGYRCSRSTPPGRSVPVASGLSLALPGGSVARIKAEHKINTLPKRKAAAFGNCPLISCPLCLGVKRGADYDTPIPVTSRKMHLVFYSKRSDARRSLRRIRLFDLILQPLGGLLGPVGEDDVGGGSRSVSKRICPEHRADPNIHQLSTCQGSTGSEIIEAWFMSS